MYIKLLCIKTSNFRDHYGEHYFTIQEGDIVDALVESQGIHIEYKPKCYSLPYRFEDIEESFISAFDEDSYNRIYKKVSNCKMYLEDGAILDLGDGIVKMEC